MKTTGVALLRQAKGARVLTDVFSTEACEAEAMEVAGIDMITTPHTHVSLIREHAPTPLIIAGLGVNDPEIVSLDEALRASFRAMNAGADAIYTGLSLAIVEGLAREMIPVVGHVGYVPYQNGWFGRPRAVGKTLDEAEAVWRRTKAFDDAGAVAVEMEIVPAPVAAEITRNVGLTVISMGSGPDCDAQYLFACDILGTSGGKPPRHARVYADLHSEMARLQTIRQDAMAAFIQDVEKGAFPGDGNTIAAKNEVSEGLREMISRES